MCDIKLLYKKNGFKQDDDKPGEPFTDDEGDGNVNVYTDEYKCDDVNQPDHILSTERPLL